MDKLYAAHGTDAAALTRELLELMQPEKGLNTGASIALKPNLVVAKDWRSGATTNPAVCAAVIEYFQSRGYKNISIIESAWLGEDTQRAFRVCGYEDLRKRYGVELVDVKRDKYSLCEYDGIKAEVSQRALQADFLINLPLIKGHCQTKLTCALKNMKGLISDKDKRRFHTMGLHQPIACLNRMIAPHLTIADGTCADPGFEEGGSPVCLNTVIAGTDSVLIDAFAAGLLGLKPKDIGYIGIAQRFCAGSADLKHAEIVHLGEGGVTPADSRNDALERAKAYINATDTCSACYANLLSALMRLGPLEDGLQISAGQGFKDKTGQLGSGSCTAGFDHCIRGCPPRADQIYDALIKLRRGQ